MLLRPQDKRLLTIVSDVVFACLTIECVALYAIYPPHQRYTNYSVIVSPDFTQEEQQAVRQAAHNWEQAVAQKAGDGRWLSIAVQVGECTHRYGEICVFSSDDSIDCIPTNHTAIGCIDSSRTMIQVDRRYGTINTFRHVSSHELGHALNLPDTKQLGTVMYSSAQPDDQQTEASQDVSPLDAENYLHQQ